MMLPPWAMTWLKANISSVLAEPIAESSNLCSSGSYFSGCGSMTGFGSGSAGSSCLSGFIGSSSASAGAAGFGWSFIAGLAGLGCGAGFSTLASAGSGVYGACSSFFSSVAKIGRSEEVTISFLAMSRFPSTMSSSD